MPSSRICGLVLLALAAPAAARAADQEVANAPVVLACVDRNGELLSSEIVHSSNIPDIDAAALKVARATKFSPGKKSSGKALRRSCLSSR